VNIAIAFFGILFVISLFGMPAALIEHRQRKLRRESRAKAWDDAWNNYEEASKRHYDLSRAEAERCRTFSREHEFCPTRKTFPHPTLNLP